SGLAVPVFKQGDDPIDAINKMMSFLSTVVTSHFPSTNNQLRNSSNPRQQATIHDGRVTVQPLQGRQNSYATGTSGTRANTSGTRGNYSGQQRIVKCFNCQGEAYQEDDLDAYDYDCNEISIAKAVLMANLSSYGPDVLSKYLIESQTAAVLDTNSSAQQDALILSVFEQLSNQVTNCNKVNNDNIISNETLSAELERYKERVKLLEERQNVDLVFYDNNLKQALGFQNPFYLKKAQQIRPMLYDGNVIAKETNVISIADSEKTLMLEKESRSKMLLKQSDPMVLEKKVSTKPIDYNELNQLSEDFGKRFIPQRELSDEQALHPIIDQSAYSPFKIEAPRELPKNTFVNVNSFVAMNDSVNYVEMYNKCLDLEAELIKQHNMVEKDKIFQKNNTYVNQTEPSFDQLFELKNFKAELQAKETTIKKLKAHIKRVNETSTSESVKKDLDEIETINIELEHRMTKLIAKNEHLKQTYKHLYDSIKPSRVCAKEQTESLVNQVNQKSVEISDLNAQL
ncbi:hypothetical protein Tco_0337346, partial [Tanacetum coccineum]